MDDQRRPRRESDEPAPNEGVRIIGADEAADAVERDDVVPRRGEDQPRYGDRPPPPPEGPRPALRFPLDASADPTRIERPPVRPPPDPVTGPVEMPHWTEPPTGEVPAVLIGDDQPLIDDDGDDLDAWSSFATSTPRWRDADDDWGDEGFMEQLASGSDDVRVGAMGDQDAEPSHDEYFGFDDLEQRVGERRGEQAAGPRFETGGDDWNATDVGEVDVPTETGDRLGEAWADQEWDDVVVDDGAEEGDVDIDLADAPLMTEEAEGAFDDDELYEDEPNEDLGSEPPSGGERDLAQAAMVGAGMGAVAIVLLLLGPKFVVPLVALILGASAMEYFSKLREVGWEAAPLLGIATCALFPFAVYWRGPAAAALVGFVAVVSVLVWYLVGAGGKEPRLLEGAGATLLGVFWIGGLGASAAALLRVNDGTALLVTAILATIAYDAGGYFAGKALGHRPLSTASPNKTWEGLVGGVGAAIVVTVVIVGILGYGPWTGLGAGLALGVGAAVAAPLGDLSQSLFKRDLGIKDMSGLIPGHGGVFDRFDAMLFVLPTVFWLAVTLGDIVA